MTLFYCPVKKSIELFLDKFYFLSKDNVFTDVLSVHIFHLQ